MAEVEKALVTEIVEKIKELHGKAKSLKGKSLVEIITAVLSVLPDVIKEVELYGDKLASSDKKELAIEVCLKYLNIKALPDSIERQLIGVLIDAIVTLLNKWFGKEWISKVVGLFSTIWNFFKKVF